jgi:predicted nucleic acid-binding protein
MSMDVLIDSCVWSLVLRRNAPDKKLAEQVRKLISDGRVRMIGPIRQEVLSGITNEEHYAKLKLTLTHFPDLTLQTRDYEYAAELYNACRRKGVQGSHTDFLLCAVSKLRKIALYTTDQDFERYSKIIGLALYTIHS